MANRLKDEIAVIKISKTTQVATYNVQTADKGNVKVIVRKKVEGKLNSIVQKALTDFEVTLEQNNSNIRIQGEFKRDHQYWMKEGHPLRLHFQGTVPYQFNVVLKTTSTGVIHIDNLDGTVRARLLFATYVIVNYSRRIKNENPNNRISYSGCDERTSECRQPSAN